MLLKCPPGAPGPDGLHYGHWANAGSDIAQILYRAYLSVLDGHAVPAGLNGVLQVFISKAPVQPRNATHLASPAQLHPLTLEHESQA